MFERLCPYSVSSFLQPAMLATSPTPMEAEPTQSLCSQLLCQAPSSCCTSSFWLFLLFHFQWELQEPWNACNKSSSKANTAARRSMPSWPPGCWCYNSHYLIWRKIPTLIFLNCYVSICCSCHWLSQHCWFQKKAPILGSSALHNLQNMVTTVTIWKKVRIISSFLIDLCSLLGRFILPADVLEPCGSQTHWTSTPEGTVIVRTTLLLHCGGDHDIEQHNEKDDSLSAADMN